MRAVRVESRYRFEYRLACVHSTLDIIVVRLGPAEIGDNSVTQILSDMPAEAVDFLSRTAMVVDNDFAPLFRIELCCEAGRVHQIAEQYRQMAPLAQTSNRASSGVAIAPSVEPLDRCGR